MALFEWDNEYSVGSDLMDSHHKQLFSLINEMHTQMKVGADEEDIKKTINELIEYTIFHFTEEEKKMAAEGYSGLEAQKRAHKTFTDKMKEYQTIAESGMAIFVVSEMSKLAVEWLKEHILVMDKQYEGQLT